MRKRLSMCLRPGALSSSSENVPLPCSVSRAAGRCPGNRPSRARCSPCFSRRRSMRMVEVLAWESVRPLMLISPPPNCSVSPGKRGLLVFFVAQEIDGPLGHERQAERPGRARRPARPGRGGIAGRSPGCRWLTIPASGASLLMSSMSATIGGGHVLDRDVGFPALLPTRTAARASGVSKAASRSRLRLLAVPAQPAGEVGAEIFLDGAGRRREVGLDLDLVLTFLAILALA